MTWSIKVDPRGNSQLLYHHRKHANQVPRSNVPAQFEFLHAPYSVFTAESGTPLPGGAAPSAARPYRIVIVAAVDNLDEQRELPLAPWA